MKIRNGFVSNSSSSSFLCNDENILLNYNIIKYEKLNKDQIKLILKDVPTLSKLLIDNNTNIYLTEYISDGSYLYSEIWQDRHPNFTEYVDGNHGFPYCEELFDNINENKNVYILKEHNGSIINEDEKWFCK